ncbi:MAG: DEAD/DEAH box helicase [Candidatus Omnitrophica bacterium]|nr:DEAD/DEAH box helicase [Candidatus Omnitrophota bacterium]
MTHAFEYDPFQAKAIAAIEQGVSALVAAPTGAGKTAIAEYAIEQALAANQSVVYTAPVKALSNQKYRDFYARYGDRIGILTGDVTLNAEAPVLIMTTEIYRNSLLEGERRFARCAWVIFDEVHYLDDPERGTVWEEALILTPPSVNILALSATISNAEQIAAWLTDVHGRGIHVIRESHRPVPLKVTFQCQGQIQRTPEELRGRGYRGRELWRSPDRHRRHREWLENLPNPVDRLITTIRQAGHLPCLYFAFGRRRVEALAAELAATDFLDADERTRLLAHFDTLCDRYRLSGDRTAAELRGLVTHGVAYHHAGMLPTLKEVVERLFSSRLVKVIVTTETFALGVNMPARSVVLDTLRKRMGGRFSTIRAREFTQMAGRAGRRGMDEAGFVYLRINPLEVSYPEVLQVIHGKPEPVLSRLNTAYATLLNLYRHHGARWFDIYHRTLHHYQSAKSARALAEGLMQRKLALLRTMGYLTEAGLTPKGTFAAGMYGYELTMGELYANGVLDRLSAEELAMLMGALVYEPRPTMPPPETLPKAVGHLTQVCDATIRAIQRAERKAFLPPTKPPHFQLAPAIEAWMRHVPFEKLGALCGADDGELVRGFRMVVQLLRQLRAIPGVSPTLKAATGQALAAVNRDVVDAEQELRMTLAL